MLQKSGRGHTREVIYTASEMIKDYGFELGIQLMIGLPGDTYEACIMSAEETVKIGPSIARLYPTVTIEDTELYSMFERGEFLPLPLSESIKRTKDMYRIFTFNGINVIRIGLKSSEAMNSEIGFHPAFKQLVMGEIAKEEIEKSPVQIEPINEKEHEYLEELKECLANGSISDGERRLLNKIRSKLGISEERAAELEQSLLTPHLTEDEQEYLDAFKDAMEDGIISDAERRLLDKMKKIYNISDERAKEIELSFLNSFDVVSDASHSQSAQSDDDYSEYNQNWLLSHNDEAIKLYKLAEQYDDEDNVDQYNLELAKDYYQQAIALGYAPAMLEYGAILEMEELYDDAFAFYSRALDEGLESAKVDLANCYKAAEGNLEITAELYGGKADGEVVRAHFDENWKQTDSDGSYLLTLYAEPKKTEAVAEAVKEDGKLLGRIPVKTHVTGGASHE